MNPLVGLQTGWTPNTPAVTQGLMGNVMQPPSQVPSLMNTNPGDWSQVAYNMAGRPIQGPYPTAPGLPMPAGVSNGTYSSGGSSIGGTALGLLGQLAKNPSLLKNAYNGISGLLGSGAIPASVAAEGNAAASAANAATGAYAANGAADVSVLPSVSGALEGGSGSGLAGATAYGTDAAVAPAAGTAATSGLLGAPALSSVGTGAVAPAVDAAAADASSALGGEAAGGLGVGAGAAAAGGLFALPLILASTVAQHDRSAAQYASMLSDLNAGPGSAGYNATAMEIAADIASGETQEYPAAVLQKAQQLGLFQTAKNLGAYKGAIGSNLRATKNQK